jgi:hypothetical protein
MEKKKIFSLFIFDRTGIFSVHVSKLNSEANRTKYLAVVYTFEYNGLFTTPRPHSEHTTVFALRYKLVKHNLSVLLVTCQ